jgi:aminoglycoside phosphotransferase (APT) family kinase protein
MMERQLLARGRTAELFTWQDGQVLKLFYDWCPAYWVDNEALINRKLLSTGLPIPGLIDRIQVDGRQGLVFERVNGATMIQVMSAKPWLLVRLARQLAELHLEMHQHSAPFLTPLRDDLRWSITQSGHLSSEQKTAVLAALDKLPDGDRLCHYDFHPDQVLLTARGPVIIDWMTGRQGHPAADVARSALIFSIGRPPALSRLQIMLFGFIQASFQRAYLQRYLALSSMVDDTEVSGWMLPIAAARLNENIPHEVPYLLRFIRDGLRSHETGTAKRSR